ncbi:N-acetylmuramoyl-L-alanine amidase [Corynebacterium macginleyi]|uniref:N-acetylmuramoyl-L-alanine amidase n=1 Tax=Corynebacterium macginleyi TaxID=38290 RepID=UPI00190A13A3|nr:N-acetylmuramoyl-L-alanine amidase [Corynebacterium macginleyi]MBK4164301.1 N-acetylmuramoyl-L-alanine amidase [Corynebacterium macginleyi]MBK4173941.1 N-acetylmuramoyl-L-alanine amidase [Corynebacterium macginleyi]
MKQRRRLVPTRSPWTTPVIATVSSIVIVAVSAFGGQQVLKTQDSHSAAPIEVKNASANFSDAESVVVDDPAVAAQGDGDGPRAVKHFHRDEPFNMFAVTWEGKRDVHSFVRSKQKDGSWSEWFDMDAMNYNEGKNGTELIYVGDTNDVQVFMANVDLVTGSNLDDNAELLDKAADAADTNRAAPLPYNVGAIAPVADENNTGRTTVSDLNAVFMDGNAQEGQVIEPTAATDGMPKVVSRSGWGADESKRCQQPTYDDGIKAMTLHHTAGSNEYTPAQAAAQVRAAYVYHAQNLGWCDIGYNVLVDKFGTIYEGRYGGLDKAVQGAHVGGFNSHNWGISMIGNYDIEEPSQKMLNSVAEIAGWKSAISNVDPSGTATLTSDGFGGSRYAAGAQATVPAFSGHNDFHYTQCPGRYTTQHWKQIRDNTKKKYDAVKAGGNSAAMNWDKTSPTSKSGHSASGETTSSIGGVDAPVSTIQALANIAAAVFGVLVANDRVTQPDADKKIAGHLTAGDIPNIVSKVVQLSGDKGLRESWTAVLNAFGPVLGLAVGGPDTTDSGKITYQLFQNGVVLSSEDTGAKALTGEIAKKWAENNNSSKLGLPTTNEIKNGKEILVQFQGGEIVYNTDTEKVDIYTD